MGASRGEAGLADGRAPRARATSTGTCCWQRLPSIWQHVTVAEPPAGSSGDRFDGCGFPINTRAARVDALVHAPAAFRRRGVYVAAQESELA